MAGSVHVEQPDSTFARIDHAHLSDQRRVLHQQIRRLRSSGTHDWPRAGRARGGGLRARAAPRRSRSAGRARWCHCARVLQAAPLGSLLAVQGDRRRCVSLLRAVDDHSLRALGDVAKEAHHHLSRPAELGRLVERVRATGTQQAAGDLELDIRGQPPRPTDRAASTASAAT
jgi:hypothetical protein